MHHAIDCSLPCTPFLLEPQVFNWVVAMESYIQSKLVIQLSIGYSGKWSYNSFLCPFLSTDIYRKGSLLRNRVDEQADTGAHHSRGINKYKTIWSGDLYQLCCQLLSQLIKIFRSKCLVLNDSSAVICSSICLLINSFICVGWLLRERRLLVATNRNSTSDLCYSTSTISANRTYHG